jgi:hypothetical protein
MSPSRFPHRSGGRPPDVLRVRLWQGVEYEPYYVDLYSGQEREPEGSDNAHQDLSEQYLPPDLGLFADQAVGWTQGVGALQVGIGTEASSFRGTVGERSWRTLLWDQGSWLATEAACLQQDGPDLVFAADGAVWQASLQGDQLSWSSLYP